MAKGIGRLEKVVTRLLGPGGCPWDRRQNHRSLIKYLREEAKELEVALDGGRWHEIEDELGDILFHVLFHSKLGAKSGKFNFDSVAGSQATKLMRRHPHVFGRAVRFKTAGDVLLGWAKIKESERALRAKDVAARNQRRSLKRGR